MSGTTAIFYGSITGRTEDVARRLSRQMDNVPVLDVTHVSARQLENFDHLVFGVPSWHLGGLSDPWYAFLPEFNRSHLEGKSVALFGLGNQIAYPDFFCNALGQVYDLLKEKKVRIVGDTSTQGYQFNHSFAVREGNFVGLVLDEISQKNRTDIRLVQWMRCLTPLLSH